MDDKIEAGETNPEEQAVEPTSETEQVTEPTSMEKEPTSEAEKAPTFTQETQDEAVKTGKAEVQSALDKKIDELNQRITQNDFEHQEALLAATEKGELAKLDEAGVPKDVVNAFQVKRRKLFDDTVAFERKMAETNILAERVSLTNKAIKAQEFAKEYGVEAKELLECETEEEMERKALKLSHKQITAKLKQAETAPQRIDSSTPSATGVDLESMSARELIQRGIEEAKK